MNGIEKTFHFQANAGTHLALQTLLLYIEENAGNWRVRGLDTQLGLSLRVGIDLEVH